MGKRTTHLSAKHRDWKPIFLEAMRHLPNVAHACEKAVISREAAYEHREKDQQFAKDWEIAMQHGIDRLEKCAMDRACDGVPEGVWRTDESGRNVKVETVRKYSDSLMNLLLRAHKPDKYREKTAFDLSVAAKDESGKSLEFTVHVSGEELP